MRWALYALVTILILVGCFPLAFSAGDEAGRYVNRDSLFVEVRLDAPAEFAHLKLGDSLQGEVTRDVYAGEQLIIPTGSRIRLTVSGLERRKREHNDHLPWVISLFRSRYETFPNFKSAEVSLPDGMKVSLQVSLVSVTHRVEVTAGAERTDGSKEKVRSALQGSVKKGSGEKASHASPTLVLVAEIPPDGDPFASLAKADHYHQTQRLRVETLAAGTKAQVVLLDKLSASKNQEGDSFRARLVEPVRQGSRILLPAGTVFDGRVAKSVPPRWLSRPGSLYLTFTRLKLPAGSSSAIAASLAGAEVDRRSRMKMDSEGGLSGGSLGKARLLLDMGIAGGITKVCDDSVQLIAEAVISSATDASTAGSARLVAAGVSGLYMLTRHGRDVVLPRYTRMDIVFDRPLSLSPTVERHEKRTESIGPRLERRLNSDELTPITWLSGEP